MEAYHQSTMGSRTLPVGVVTALFANMLSLLHACFRFFTHTLIGRKHAPRTLETYEYTSLDPKEPSFRLLKLLRRKSQELECELLHQSLSPGEHAPYEALSYTWGSSELVETITVDGKQCWITENLYSALQCLRQDDRDRYLWIDAICINQADKEEQSHQVQQMGEIYSNAGKVLIWLGKATSEIINLMDALEQFGKVSTHRVPGRWPLDNGLWESHRTGLLQLLDRPWFTRVWILQEVANARKADICCGTRSIPAEIFTLAPALMGETPPPHCQAVLDIMPGSSRATSWWAQERDLYTLLSRFRASKATDERDKIFALLGLSNNPLDTQNIVIDYEKPTEEVIKEAMTYLLQPNQPTHSPVAVCDVLNLMTSFETLETTYFVPELRAEDATEIVFPHLKSGSVPSKSQEPDFLSDGTLVVCDPKLFLFEKKPQKNNKQQEMCEGQESRLTLNAQTSNLTSYRAHEDGLRVIPWGVVDQSVKLVVISCMRTAILRAGVRHDELVVKHLLQVDARFTSEESNALFALEVAADHGYVQLVQTLLGLTTMGNTKERVLMNGLQDEAPNGGENEEDISELQLEVGMDVNTKEASICLALHTACRSGHKQVVEAFIESGVDINMPSPRYSNALHAAVDNRDLDKAEEVTRFLLDAGAEINLEGREHGSIVYTAVLAAFECSKVVEILLSIDAEVNIQGGYYGDALQAAVTSLMGGASLEVTEILIKAGADVHAEGGLYGNALQAAAFRGNRQAVELLLHAGADANKGAYTIIPHIHNPLQAAQVGLRAGVERDSIVKALLDAGALAFEE